MNFSIENDPPPLPTAHHRPSGTFPKNNLFWQRHTSLNRSYCGKCIQPVWICYAFGISTFTFLKVGQNDSDLTFFFLRQKFYHDT